jgi:hypothetical protein
VDAGCKFGGGVSCSGGDAKSPSQNFGSPARLVGGY